MNRKSRLVCVLLLFCLPGVLLAAEDRLPVGLAAFYNVFPGFGTGSILQKDYLGGAILITADVTASLLVLSGIFSMAILSPSPDDMEIHGKLIIIAFCIYSGAKVLGLIFPVLYNAFSGSDSASTTARIPAVAVRPRLVAASGHKPAVGVSLSLVWQ